jgi:hypothetical protein
MKKMLRGYTCGACALWICAWGAAEGGSPAHQKTAAETLGYPADSAGGPGLDGFLSHLGYPGGCPRSLAFGDRGDPTNLSPPRFASRV